MGCTGSTPAMAGMDAKGEFKMVNGINANGEVPSPVAFVIPLDEKDSLIKKHPPKKFQRLEEQLHSPPVLTHKMLQDKLAEAEQRRLQILNERIESAKILMKPKYSNGKENLMNGMTEAPKIIDVEG